MKRITAKTNQAQKPYRCLNKRDFINGNAMYVLGEIEDLLEEAGYGKYDNDSNSRAITYLRELRENLKSKETEEMMEGVSCGVIESEEKVLGESDEVLESVESIDEQSETSATQEVTETETTEEMKNALFTEDFNEEEMKEISAMINDMSENTTVEGSTDIEEPVVEKPKRKRRTKKEIEEAKANEGTTETSETSATQEVTESATEDTATEVAVENSEEFNLFSE